MEDRYNIGIDIGGTKVNIGIVKDKGEVIDKVKMPVSKAASYGKVVAEICEEMKALLLKNNLELEDIYFIGIGVPGTVDVKTGFVTYCPNLYWYDVPIGEMFKNYLGRDVKVMQDSRNAALAETLLGAGRKYDNTMCVSIGTGIGCGIIIDRKIFNGGMNTAGELGHTPVVKDGRLCVCGNRGCLERYVSGTGIRDRAIDLFPEKFKSEEEKCSEYVFELAYQGDKDILAFIDECVDYLAFGIANAVNLLSPEAIIISGGLCVHEELMINPLREKIMKHGYYAWKKQDKLQVCKAELGSDAAMIGAALMYKGL